MAFQKGQSGNLSGRPVGSVNKSTALKKALSDNDIQDLLQVVYRQAMDGDTTSQKLILERIIPPVRHSDPPVRLPLTGCIESDVHTVLEALGRGEIGPTSAKAVLETIDKASECLKVPLLEAEIQRITEGSIDGP